MADRRIALIVSERERLGRGTATPERLEKLPLDSVEVTTDQTQRVLTGPLQRLHKMGALTHREYWAGHQFQSDHYESHVDPGPPTVDLNATSSRPASRSPSMFANQAIADARLRWRSTGRAFHHHGLLWNLLLNALVSEHTLEQLGHDFFGHRDRRDARAAAKAAFRTALSALADHYRL